MITVSFETEGLERALEELPGRIQARAAEGIDATCEAIAARARETSKYKDRTGLLRASTQNAGVTTDGQEVVGVVSFAARSSRGYLYGLALEFGTHAGARQRTKRQERREAGARFKGPRQRSGIKAMRFIRDAVDAQTSDLFEDAVSRAFQDAGFAVRVV